jgi:hypothetical protein
MGADKKYTTQLQAGLGLVNETKALLELWSPGKSASQLYQEALQSGRFPNVTARRLRNVVAECFAPRYLTAEAGRVPADDLKKLVGCISSNDLSQLMVIFTSRANPILGDFIREVYWARYSGGYSEISNLDARVFVERAVDDGKTLKRWSESTIRRVSAYLTGCCADYGLLERGTKSKRRILALRISSITAAYLAYDLHFSKNGDNAILEHPDWQLFGLERGDVLEELKRLSLKGVLIVQAAGDVVRISWKQPDMEALCDVLSQG